MNTNNYFLSFSRIMMVMKREVMENWKTNILRFIGLYAAFALVMAGYMWGMSGNDNAFADPGVFYQRFCSNITGAFTFIIGIASLVYAANIMENMITKEKRISYLMLPATMIEKFAARFLIVTVGFGVTVVIALSLAEITRYLVLPLFNLPDLFRQSILYNIVSNVFIDSEQAFRSPGAFNMPYHGWLGEICEWTFLIWSHSLYILGGNYWYKKPFFKTLGMLMLLSVLCSVVSVHAFSWMGEESIRNFGEWLETNFQWMTLNKLLSVSIACFSAFTMFNWWLSYRLFTHSQVVKSQSRLL